jgi:carbonic anhydrase
MKFLHRSFIALFISLYLIGVVVSYDFSNAQCQSTNGQQSPINLSTDTSLYYEEKYFRFLTNNYDLLTNNTWSAFPTERAIGIGPLPGQDNMGNFVFVKDWAMYSFKLNKILFRVNSEHSINGQRFDAEMQFVHTIDANYYPPGRRTELGVDYLVISLFFRATDDKNPGATKLFDFMNLRNSTIGVAPTTGQTFIKNIKLNYLVQHQPSLLYQGTLSYPECQPALWLLMTQYHLITNTELQALKTMVTNQNFADPSNGGFNTRKQFPTVAQVYRNWDDKSRILPMVTLMNYNAATMVSTSGFFLILLILAILF